MVKILYEKQGNLQVVPEYQGKSPINFKIVNVQTGELVRRFGTLSEAETYVRRTVGK